MNRGQSALVLDVIFACIFDNYCRWFSLDSQNQSCFSVIFTSERMDVCISPESMHVATDSLWPRFTANA